MAKRREWTWVPAKPAKPAVPYEVKAEVQRKADELVQKHLKPQHVKPPEDPRWNYLTGIHTKWHHAFFYLVGDYASPGPNRLSPTFEHPFARLEYTWEGRFNLAYMRHTGQWVELYDALTVNECLKAIQDDAWFVP